jgi:DNA-binding FadR family transcriptional regulator
VLYSNVRITRLFEQVAEQIEASILEGVFSTGDRLPSERQLAQRCGVSRNVVREAVKRLSQKNLVETRSGRGTFVIARTR